MNVPESQNGQNDSILYMWPDFLEHWYIILILICLFTIHGVNYAVSDCSSARINPGLSLYRSCLTLEENIVAVITQDRVIDNNLKRQIKNQTCVLVDYSY